MLISTRARTCSSVPLAMEPRMIVASTLTLAGDESQEIIWMSLETTPCCTTKPFCLLLPMTAFFKHLPKTEEIAISPVGMSQRPRKSHMSAFKHFASSEE